MNEQQVAWIEIERGFNLTFQSCWRSWKVPKIGPGWFNWPHYTVLDEQPPEEVKQHGVGRSIGHKCEP